MVPASSCRSLLNKRDRNEGWDINELQRSTTSALLAECLRFGLYDLSLKASMRLAEVTMLPWGPAKVLPHLLPLLVRRFALHKPFLMRPFFGSHGGRPL